MNRPDDAISLRGLTLDRYARLEPASSAHLLQATWREHVCSHDESEQRRDQFDFVIA